MTQNLTTTMTNQQQIIDLLIEFLEQALATFTQSEEFGAVNRLDEDLYTEALCDHLDEQSRDTKYDIFRFGTQRIQEKSRNKKGKARTVDIGIKHRSKRSVYIFTVEAKFLPHTDYILGEYAAIKRFKRLEHGTSSVNENIGYPLQESAIVAYVKKGNFDTHLAKINDKIKSLSEENNTDFELTWSICERLYPIELADISKEQELAHLISKHKRIDGSEITLHHFWIKL